MIPRHLVIAVFVLLLAVFLMGIYAGHMRSRATRTPAIVDSRPVPPPISGPAEQATLYVAYDDSGTLRPQTVSVPLHAAREQRAEELLRALLGIYLSKGSPHPLAPGAEIRAVYLVTPGIAVIDFNAAFANGHRSGVLAEELTVASFIQTLTANLPGILRVRILVDGHDRETLAGHADLSDFYDTAAVAQVVAQMQ